MSICFNLFGIGSVNVAFGSRGIGIRMSSRLDEVEACMDAVVHDLAPVDTVFLLQVGVEARLDVLNDRFPAARENL